MSAPERIKLEDVTDEALRGNLPVRIYSAEHHAYWRPGGNGYCSCSCVAGVFDLADAYRRTRHCGPEKRIEFEPVPPPVARPESEYHEDMGPVLWWSFPVQEAPWCGRPDDSDWPGYHTHFTPLPAAPVPA
jgi:hypothetical protein